MFNRKKCPKCSSKVSDSYNFCPSCGYSTGKNHSKDDFGMLGQNDYEEENLNPFQNSLFGSISGKMINKMIESTMKMLEKEMQKEMKKQEKDYEPKTNFQLFINGKKAEFGNMQKKQQSHEKDMVEEVDLPNNELKSYSKLQKKEPTTNVRRFSDKVVYEINMPGVNSEEDLSIARLENSIEIKAVSKNKAYKKIVPVSLPITSYDLSKGKLVLEMKGE